MGGAALIIFCLTLSTNKSMRASVVLFFSLWTFSAYSVAATDRDQEYGQPLGPSYDCDQVRSTFDRIVCSDPLLSRLDLALDATYKGTLENAYVELENLDLDSEKIPIEAIFKVPRNQLKDAQKRWWNMLEVVCDLDFDFNIGIGERFRAVQCLIDAYAKRIVELEGEHMILEALLDLGSADLYPIEIDLGNVQIILPHMVLGKSREIQVPDIPHPACIYALLNTNLSTSLDCDSCHAGTGHLPWRHDGNYIDYVPWHPYAMFGRMSDDRFGYRILEELQDGGTLLDITEQYTGAGATRVAHILVVVYGFVEDLITMELPLIRLDGGELADICRSINEAASPKTVITLKINISADSLVTLCDWSL